MEKVSIFGLDLAKNVFQVHGARADGSVGFRKKLSRRKVMMFFATQPWCVVAMEACASSHYWATMPVLLADGLDARIETLYKLVRRYCRNTPVPS